MKKVWSLITKPFKSFFVWILSVSLRQHGKRIFFLTTLFMQLAKLQEFQKEKMAKFNESLKLARDESALELPSAMHRVIWDKDNLEQTIQDAVAGDILCSTLDPEDASRACGKIVDASPGWMRYGRREDMVKDVMRLIATSRDI